MKNLLVTICSYNRAERLPALIRNLRQQTCPIPFSIVIINNNSTDNTLEILQQLEKEPGAKLRFVTENKQGISHARNRAIEESLASDYMFVMDDDELPKPGILAAVYHSLDSDNFDCVGGKVDVCFAPGTKPKWLNAELLGFLAETNYGNDFFQITDSSTPIWTANIAYKTEVFRKNSSLRFDIRYNREGKAVGGGEDFMMFSAWFNQGYKLAYNPKMIVEHFIEDWRLKQSYFFKLHFTAGKKKGLFDFPEYKNTIFGIPLFLFHQALSQSLKTVKMYAFNHPNRVRQGMNTSYALGVIAGTYKKAS